MNTNVKEWIQMLWWIMIWYRLYFIVDLGFFRILMLDSWLGYRLDLIVDPDWMDTNVDIGWIQMLQKIYLNVDTEWIRMLKNGYTKVMMYYDLI